MQYRGSYKIIEKPETRVLIKCLNRLQTLEQAESIWFCKNDEEAVKVYNMFVDQKNHIFDKLFRYYERNYNVDFSKIPDEYYEAKVEEICETIKSWEEIVL